jgi:hypothetical protein
MSTMRSKRCCNNGIAFGTVSVLVHLGEIHVKLHGEPCCEKEFSSFIEILTMMRHRLATDAPFYILYNLTQCPFNRSYMKAQEKVLAGAFACVVIVRNTMLRRAVVLATILQKKTKMKICESQAEGLRWLKTIQLQEKH